MRNILYVYILFGTLIFGSWKNKSRVVHECVYKGKQIKAIINVPFPYSKSYEHYDGESCSQLILLLEDSSVFFISEKAVNYNYRYIDTDKELSEEYTLKRFNDVDFKISGTNKGLRWCTIRKGPFYIGYSNTDKKLVENYNQILNEVKVVW